MGQNKFLMIKTLLYFISNPSLTFIFLHLTKVSLELVEVHYNNMLAISFCLWIKKDSLIHDICNSSNQTQKMAIIDYLNITAYNGHNNQILKPMIPEMEL